MSSGVFGLLTVTADAQLSVAAASDLRFVLRDLGALFESRTGEKLGVTYGSSGNFFSQIQNGAPFDLFFSADLEYPRRLEALGLAEPGTFHQYGVGRIVIWVPHDAPVDPEKQNWEALLDPALKRIAIANPAHAPYGRAAVAALKKAGIYGRVAHKLVFGESISQAAQFVESGNAQAGILALSLALSPAMRGKGRFWSVPSDMHAPLRQAGVALRSSSNKDAARAFLEFLKSAEAKQILREYGFEIPADKQSRGESR